MKLIDQWEADAKNNLKYEKGKRFYEPMWAADAKIILALIDLVRKKDEALSEMQSCPEGHLTKIAREALALTEELK